MELNIFEILLLLAAHFVGDFVLQTDEMARKKSKEFFYLFWHVAYYCIPIAVVCFLITVVRVWHHVHTPLLGSLWMGATTFLFHLCTDKITSRFSGKHFGKDWHNFFVIVGFDQLLHAVQLIVCFYLFMR